MFAKPYSEGIKDKTFLETIRSSLPLLFNSVWFTECVLNK